MKKCKIRLTDNSKKLISMLEIDNVKAMIQELQNQELETAIYDYLDIAMSPIKYSDWRFYDVEMEICRNARVPYNYYTENSAYYDVWVNFKAFNDFDGFYVVGICLSDIYSISDDNKQEIRQYMYVREYTEKR